MKYGLTFVLLLSMVSFAHASGEVVMYDVNGEPFEGYFTSPSPNAKVCPGGNKGSKSPDIVFITILSWV